MASSPTVFQRIRTELPFTKISFLALLGVLSIKAYGLTVRWEEVKTYYSRIDWNGAWWSQLDWLLYGNFLAMTLLIVAGVKWREDLLLACCGFAGGFLIESWGTQSRLWAYYTSERPPMWIIPMWSVATVAIVHLMRLLEAALPVWKEKTYQKIHHGIWLFWMALMGTFVRAHLQHPLTMLAVTICFVVFLTTRDYRRTVLIFLAGSMLGYFLELWGTTRTCWIYYTGERPPLFSVAAHGMAALSIGRGAQILAFTWQRLKPTNSTRKENFS